VISGMVSVMLNMRVDRMYEKRTAWAASLTDPESEDYQQLEWESVRAVIIIYNLSFNLNHRNNFTFHRMLEICELTQRNK
jgi:hypothetical protein